MRTVLLFILVNHKVIHNEIVALLPSVRLEVSIFMLTVAVVAMWVHCRNGNVGWQSVGLIYHFSPDWNISKLWDCNIHHFELFVLTTIGGIVTEFGIKVILESMNCNSFYDPTEVNLAPSPGTNLILSNNIDQSETKCWSGLVLVTSWFNPTKLLSIGSLFHGHESL